ncbi:MAG: hypothetical protein EXR71_15760 [Myxococcales bacterium]|nr:hypothetical protein [Myxococcales bacterium]
MGTLYWLAAAALAEDVDEDALFGAAPPAEAPPVAAALPVGDLGIEITETAAADILSRIGLADERLTVGGKLYLRATSSIYADTDPEDTLYSSPNLLDLFTDVRPNDRVRGFAQARLTYDFTIADGDEDYLGNDLEPASVALDQLWVKFDLANRVFVTAGRQRIRWGSGRFWNPTDVLSQQTLNALDVAVFDTRTGVTLLKVHVPIETLGANLYAVANFDGADTIGQIGGALRTEWVLGPSEIALTAAAREGDPVRLGADLSAAVGPVDLRVEGAVRHGDETPTYEGDFDIATLTLPEEVDHRDEWIPQLVAGAEIGVQINDDDTLYVGGEYFYNGSGYADSTLYPFLLVKGAFTPFYLGEHYFGVYVAVPGPGNWDDTSFTVSTLGNLSDHTYASRLDVSTRLNTFLSVNGYAGVYYGDNGEFHFSYHLDPIEGMLPDGVDIPAPIATVGAGAMVNF